MFLSNSRATVAVCAALLVLAACSQSNTVPSSPSNGAPLQTSSSQAPIATSQASKGKKTDTTSILKQDTKNVVIGSTVDPTNGDKGPHGLAVVRATIGSLTKGELLACNFADSSGTAGNGTTIELLKATTGASPSTFAQSSDIKGCAGVTVSPLSDFVFGAGMTSGEMTEFNTKGVVQTTFGSPLEAPFSDIDVSCKGDGEAAKVLPAMCAYAAEYVFTSDAKAGTLVSAGVNNYASGLYTQVVNGFATNSGSGWGALGPAGLQYDLVGKKSYLYVVDGVTNTLVQITNPQDLLVQNEITVSSNGKTFTCKYKKTTCGKLIYSGSPLNGPVAMTLLPNGNVIVANSGGATGSKGNELVEIDTAGKVLDTEVVDTGAAPALFGLASNGTADSNTVIYYTDTNDNSIHELEK
jgi:hypothetical protein